MPGPLLAVWDTVSQNSKNLVGSRGVNSTVGQRCPKWPVCPASNLRACRLHPATQHLRHAPRLRDAPAWRIGGLGVKNFADGTDACLIQVRDETFQKLPCRRQFLGV